MPRPKRQRPAWLPRWVPFKDGRLLGLARQTVLAWTSTILALCFFLLTVSYATEKTQFSRVKFVHSSGSNTILVLRILSEAAGVFLAGSIYSTFEVVQWVLISRPDGIKIPQFLALQSSTGLLGLIILAFGRGLPPSQWPMTPRLLALLRLIAGLTIPVLGVLIMSNVNTSVIYTPIADTVEPFALGMQEFNHSVAPQLGVMQDLLFNINYVTFLYNPLHAVNLDGKLDQTRGCVKGTGLTKNDSCTRHILVAQEYQNVEARLGMTEHLESNVVLSENQQVYSLEYRDNVELSKDVRNCKTFESGPVQYLFCIENHDDTWIRAEMIPCPVDLITSKTCAQDKSWHSSPGFSTALRASFLQATISYDRQDGRILSHKVDTEVESKQTNLDSAELLSAFTIILNSTVPDQPDISSSILGTPSHFFGRLIAGHMYRIGKGMQTNPTARLKGINAIQSLLGLVLFYCQNGILSQTVLPFAPNSGNQSQLSSGAFEEENKTAIVALAETKYRIKVGRATLIAYIVLSSATLLVCIIALIIGSILELVKFEAEPTLWPTLDFWTQCRVEDGNGKVITADKRVELAWIYHGQELFKEIETLRVKRRKRKMRTPELELPTVGEG